MALRKIGLWLVGAHGGVATTVAVGLSALRQGLIKPTGLVSETPGFVDLPFTQWGEWVLGGHEIRQTSAVASAQDLARTSRAFSEQLVEKCRPDLERLDRSVRPGVVRNVGNTIRQLMSPGFAREAGSARDLISLLQADWDEFVAQQELDQVVVVNLASTEPPVSRELLPTDSAGLLASLDHAECPLPASSLYAIAAIERGHPFVNFTPSLGSDLPAIDELAKQRGSAHVGRDGKTGETFLKSVLAPAFAARNLEVMSWVGHNIFGNLDGVVLNDPVNKATKVASKDKLLGEILGYTPQTLVSIEYIQSLGDWKTAWDHIHFRGFLETPMVMQFTWQGCDSILAAPLVLDLARFAELAARRGASGTLDFLASFFKSPQGSPTHHFFEQFAHLQRWAAEQRQARE
jgi:myo-inositol-1-phosphate synthase